MTILPKLQENMGQSVMSGLTNTTVPKDLPFSIFLSRSRKIMEDSLDTEESVKTGRLNDVLAVELFIMKYSAK